MIANASAIVGLVFACGIQYQKITNLEIRDAERRASIQELNRVASLAGVTAVEITNLKATMSRIDATLTQILEERRDDRVVRDIRHPAGK